MPGSPPFAPPRLRPPSPGRPAPSPARRRPAGAAGTAHMSRLRARRPRQPGEQMKCPLETSGEVTHLLGELGPRYVKERAERAGTSARSSSSRSGFPNMSCTVLAIRPTWTPSAGQRLEHTCRRRRRSRPVADVAAGLPGIGVPGSATGARADSDGTSPDSSGSSMASTSRGLPMLGPGVVDATRNRLASAASRQVAKPLGPSARRNSPVVWSQVAAYGIHAVRANEKNGATPGCPTSRRCEGSPPSLPPPRRVNVTSVATLERRPPQEP
jgi:hypothetical protein